ncbi:MAG: bifunctional ornithine acetyltransferase/N-acetylglutamate synthase, partial [Candidatus Dormibacteria bacterium]
WIAAARGIMTTDTVHKAASRRVDIDGRAVSVSGIAKGAGMIHPDMATLLVFVTTDAPASPELLQPLLTRVIDDTFNCVTIDGDSSTNDTVLLLANGAAGGDEIVAGSSGAAALEQAVLTVCESLAEQVVADAEGSEKHFEVVVRGAADDVQARTAARVVAGSPLVKTAIHGSDPNWGRIVAALGRSGATFTLDRCSVAIGGLPVFAAGSPAPVDDGALRAHLAGSRIEVAIDLGAGEGRGRAWGCDLTAEYVHINADYTT